VRSCVTVDAVEGLTEVGQRRGFGPQFAVDGVGIAGELDERVPLDGHLAGDGFLGLGDLLVDAAKGTPGPVVAILVVDDLVTAPAGRPARPWLGEHVTVGDVLAGRSRCHWATI
jgi:hypothetical protein